VGERLRILIQAIGRLFAWLWRTIVTLFSALGRWLSRRSRLSATRRQQRAKERERREVFEHIGKMVYVLYKRSLVRNHDLLAECEKVRELDGEIDQLMERADRIRTADAPEPEPQPRVAASPADVAAPGEQVETGASVAVSQR
jgi:hypothetical protein